MTGIEITFLIIGLIVFVASFILTDKFDQNEVSNVTKEMTEKQREDIKKQILSIFDEQMDDLKEKTEVSLDKLSGEKMNEMNEYAETILNEINRNHNEVMFLYDMLNEKKKEINNTVRDLNIVNKELKTQNAAPAVTEEPAKEAQAEKPKRAVKPKKEQILDQLDAVSENVANEIDADQAVPEPPKPRRKNTAKTAAERTRNAVKKETEREENKDITVFETGNNNEKILELSREGKSNVEIAKALGLGIGEVKLVVDLFKGGK